MSYLPDVNLWLALTFESHVHHASASKWFNGLASGASCAFCRLSQQGFLRLATNPRAFGEEAVSLAEAWRLYDSLRADPRVTYREEPASIEPAWRELTTRHHFSPKVWSDAFLAAFAREAGLELVTFDQSIGHYVSVKCRVLR